MSKSDGVKDVFKWVDKKCKEQKKVVEKAEINLKETERFCCFEDEMCLIDFAKIDLEREQAKLQAFVEVKIGVEKYMKKLRHQGE